MPKSNRAWKVWVEPSGKSWRCRWSGCYGSGQQVFIYKSEADELKADKRTTFSRLDAGLQLPTKPAPYRTIGVFAEEYLLYSKKEKKPRTFLQFDTPAVRSLRAFLGDKKPLREVLPSDVQAWKHSLPQETPQQRTTASMLYRQGVAFFNYAVKMKFLDVSPAKGLAKPKAGPGGRALLDEELVALMAVAPEPLKRTGKFSLETYLRIEEVVIFDWSWAWEVPGLGWMGRIPKELRKNSRTAEKDCVFPITDEARAQMGEQKKSGRVFPWSKNQIQKQIMVARRAAKLPDDITFHSFRHTGATRYLGNGGHMEDLLESGTGQWQDPRSLLRYVHVHPETLHKRFSAVAYPWRKPAPIEPLKAESRRPESPDDGS